jgi:putative ABC transport system ATP-binding protein
MSTLIEIKNLKKLFKEEGNEILAVNDINLKINNGEFTAIVGPSGSGKTTILNLLGGIDRPTEGEIIIDNTNITKLKNSELVNFRLFNIGFVFQSFNLIPVLTARENVEFVMYLQKMPKGERAKRSEELLRAIGLADRMNSRPARLSGGQQQRIAVARALASHPKVILADEPTANLDSKSAADLLDIMESLNSIEKTTFIFSTHDPEMMKKARRIITLLDGRVVGDDVY